jgi:hypothetical protein
MGHPLLCLVDLYLGRLEIVVTFFFWIDFTWRTSASAYGLSAFGSEWVVSWTHCSEFKSRNVDCADLRRAILVGLFTWRDEANSKLRAQSSAEAVWRHN